ncbi:MAG: hypothetical protein VX944_06290 [Myxococcota bacterium]|nr:hypothetical protein [Myxococcota bacterium]
MMCDVSGPAPASELAFAIEPLSLPVEWELDDDSECGVFRRL